MSQTIEIPRAGWKSYLDSLGNVMRNHSIRVEVEPKGAREWKAIVEEMPLVGLSVDSKGSGQGDIEVTVECRAPAGDSLEHRIHRPSSLVAQTDDDGKVLLLDLDDSGGHTRIHFD